MADVFILHVYYIYIYIYMHAILYKYHSVSLFLFTCGWEAVCITASLQYGSMFLISLYSYILYFCFLYYTLCCCMQERYRGCKYAMKGLSPVWPQHNMIDSVKFEYYLVFFLVFHLEVVLYPFGDNLGLLAKL